MRRSAMPFLMMAAASLAVPVSAVPPPVPPPLAQAVANCAAPTYASDQLVCDDGPLRALDGELARLLPVRAAPGVAIEQQEDWFRRSRMCAMRADHRACLAAAYRERIAVLRAARVFDPADAPWRSGRCAPAAAELAELAGGITAVRRGGKTTLALAGADTSAWSPFAWTMTKGQRYTVRRLDGSVLKCRVVARR